MNIHARALLFAVCLGSLIGSAGVSTAATVKTQAPCVEPGFDYCVSFTHTPATVLIRALHFTAPSAGTAIVTFHGSMVCSNSEDFLDLFSQILDTNGRPDLTGPGALRHKTRLAPAPAGTTFNLASTRVFTIASAGSTTFRFRIFKFEMYEPTVCKAYTAVFTVQFVP